jgi:hypothetical protein
MNYQNLILQEIHVSSAAYTTNFNHALAKKFFNLGIQQGLSTFNTCEY